MSRFACLCLTLALLAVSACRKSEKFIEEERRFEAIEAGAGFSLHDVPKGIHRLVVNFFAPDCPPCEKEIPALKKFYEKHRETSVGFIAIGSSLKAVEQNPRPGKDPPLTDREIKAELAVFAKKFPQPYPRYVASGDDLKAWRITGFPETFIFSREDGILRFRKKIISEVTLEDLERETAGK